MGMPNGTIEYVTESPCIEALVSGIPMKHGLPWAERGRALEKYRNTPPNEPRPRTEGHTLEKAIQSHSGHVTSLANERGVRLLSVSLSRLAGAPLSESAFPHAHARGTKTAFPPPTRARFPPRTPRARPPVEGCRGITTDVPRGFVFVAICGEDRIVEGPFLPGGEPRTWVRRGLSLRAPGRKTNEILRGISSDIVRYRPNIERRRRGIRHFAPETGPLLALRCRKSEKEFLPHFLRRGVGDANGITGPVQNFNFGIKIHCFEPKSNPKLTEILRGKKEKKMTPGPMWDGTNAMRMPCCRNAAATLRTTLRPGKRMANRASTETKTELTVTPSRMDIVHVRMRSPVEMRRVARRGCSLLLPGMLGGMLGVRLLDVLGV
mmetsp:Transcript_3193/g.7097  ORF Transcript_3193/g.7097 Transcript_3193/m.7097 type:complete len:378 (-) Transcript_3193:40-1173(-)